VPSRTSESKLRNYIRGLREDLFTALQYLWEGCEEVHDDQNLGDGTENGRRHVLQVEANIWRLISASKGLPNSEFEAEELFVLSAASCCHDFDKALKRYNADSWPFDLLHGSGSAEFVMDNYKTIGLGGKKNLARRICEICKIHSLNSPDFEQAIGEFPIETATPSGPIKMRRATAILKAADILHTDESRTRSIAFGPSDLKDDAQSKYLARNCIEGWRNERDTVIINAEYESNEQYESLKACEEYMTKKEWPCVATFLELYNLPHGLIFDIKPIRRGVIDMSNKKLVKVDRKRNFSIEVMDRVLKVTTKLARDYVCRNQYVLHAMGTAISLLAVDIVTSRLRYVERSLEGFACDLAEEEVYSAEKLAEHIKFLSHLESTLKQLIHELMGVAGSDLAKATRRGKSIATFSDVVCALPGCKEIIRDDLSDVLRRLTREIKNLNKVLLKVETRIAKLKKTERESARRNEKRYQKTIKPALKSFFPVLRDLKESVGNAAEKMAALGEKAAQDWGDNASDILLVDEDCKID